MMMMNISRDLEFENLAAIAVPHKQVPVGIHFQAELPPLLSTYQSSTNDPLDHRWLGIRLWPPAEPHFVDSNKHIGKGRIEICSCTVRGSADCVRQHIEEEREALKCDLGQTFYDLGFDEMGESVSKRWRPDEEFNFEELVRVHPSGPKTSFWDHISVAFPSKSRMELVSYYFNVFVLRRRALQNRYCPDNIDSDDDETMLLENESDESTSYPDDEDGDSEIEDDPSEGAVDDHLSSLTEDDDGEECIHDSDATISKEEPNGLRKDLVSEPSGMILMTVAPQAESFDSSTSDWFDVTNSARDSQAIQKWQPPWDQTLHHSRQQESQSGTSCALFFNDIQAGQCELRCKDFCDFTQAGEANLKCKEFCDETQGKEDGLRCNPELLHFESKVWDGPTKISSQKDDKLLSTNGMMREFFGDDDCKEKPWK